MQVYKTKWFRRYARHEGISDASLCEAIGRAERGIVDADLGGGLVKQRIARQGQGRSGGFRTLIAFRSLDRAVFLYGFAKNERDNVEPDELESWRNVACDFLGASLKQIETMVEEDKLTEVCCVEDE